jgi:4'-phosphopantetheinyl transferase
LNARALENESHVWYADLDLDEREAAEFTGLLDAGERARANRFAFPHLRTRFIAAHALVRQVIGSYLGIAPEEVEFAYSSQGKPHLPQGGGLRFNLSHSSKMAAVAVACNYEVGVDIEDLRTLPDRMDLARRYFSPAEVKWLEGVSPDRQTAAFFDCWTAKEAYLKARGDGLSFPLDAFQVLPGEAPDDLRLAVYREPGEAAHWLMRRFRIGEAATGALAIESPANFSLCRKWLLRKPHA